METPNNKPQETLGADIQIERLRALRDRALALLENVCSDLQPFLHKEDQLTFRRTPQSPSERGDVNVTTTCSCVMALALTDSLTKTYECPDEDELKKKILALTRSVIDAAWTSSGLVNNNAFTTALVL